MKNEEFLIHKLNERKSNHAFRQLTTPTGVDFSSNDYLGLASNLELAKRIHQQSQLTQAAIGAKGSRLISGNSRLHEELENFLADYHRGESALLYNSGYDANVGFFSCVPQRGDTIIYDKLSHASIRDGLRLSTAKSISFEHNNANDLEQKLQQTEGRKFVAVEALYSMDGDLAPLLEIAQLCTKYEALLIVDEAHSNGIYGNGKGLCCELRIEDHVFARLFTFGKAIGTHGACWVGSRTLREYLINFSRSFIYTTALPAHQLVSIQLAYESMISATVEREKLANNITRFRSGLNGKAIKLMSSSSPIQSIVVPGNTAVIAAAKHLNNKGIDVRPIRYPTVPAGEERIRIIIHSFNTNQEIDVLVESLLEIES